MTDHVYRSSELYEPRDDARQPSALQTIQPSQHEFAETIVVEFDTHQRSLFTFARTALRDPDLADEIVQEAFVRLISEARAGRMPDNPGGWLYRVCTNLVMSTLRRRAVRSRWRLLFRPADSLPSAEDSLLSRERREHVQAKLDALPADGRTAILLAARGLSGQQIAEALGRSEAATRVLLCRARRRLREEMTAEGLE